MTQVRYILLAPVDETSFGVKPGDTAGMLTAALRAEISLIPSGDCLYATASTPDILVDYLKDVEEMPAGLVIAEYDPNVWVCDSKPADNPE